MKKTVVIGASLNPERTSHEAVLRLTMNGHEVIAIGRREGEAGGIMIQKGKPAVDDVDTVSMYINAKRQEDMIDYVLSLKPKRIIFNPGAENPEFFNRASSLGIESLEACTLTMLAIGIY